MLYGEKWNPYENKKGDARGVNEYAGGIESVKTALRLSLSQVVRVFELPLRDLIWRQQKVMSYLLTTTFSSVGLALAVGKNYSSSGHMDLDSGFTFAYVHL